MIILLFEKEQKGLFISCVPMVASGIAEFSDSREKRTKRDCYPQPPT